ncbi:uncharacterized protein LOC131001586 isoform X4 [Salvia miltiorrhiza]|uniref:uncharacterized protein LOC131001586 isoform X4 n=1 Tax=Salvia miltiorrhiza TaxID=226208 RepID=UPI0025ABDD20|nr:uncharacterized protein LOC131001586 isoform X4 [Salvia miltiorrhiza]
MAVEASVGSSIASPSAKRVKSTGKSAVGSPVSESGDGVNCHQCRRKTRDITAACKNHRKNKPCLVKICSKCLLNRYGEKVEEVASVEEWICPKCRGICNCSVCMKRRGHQPTGVLINTAKATGYSSVSEMLISERLHHENVGIATNASLENEVVFSARKRGKENSNDGQLGAHSKKTKRCKSAKTSHIVLPLGTDLTSVAGIDVPAEDVGSALEFLEFCSVFGEILEMKNGEAKYVLQDLLHGRTAKRGRLCPVVLFHMHLLSIIKMEQGEKFAKLKPSSWFDTLKKCLAESQRVLKALGMDYLEKAADYDALNASEKLRALNLLCIHVLGTKKLRNWIEDQNKQFEQKTKEAKSKVFDATDKTSQLKIKGDIAKAIDARDGEREARARLLESEAMLLKTDAMRIEPIFMECSGHMYWKLNCADESDVLHQYVGKGDTLTLNEKWFALSAEEKEVIEKNISTRTL